jgi:hypothetical protein
MTDPRMEAPAGILVYRSLIHRRDKAHPHNSLDTLGNYPQSLINTRKKSLSACSKISFLKKGPILARLFSSKTPSNRRKKTPIAGGSKTA